MYMNFLRSELKAWARDPMLSFMVFYPILFGIIGRFVLPLAAENSGFDINAYADVVIVALTLMTPLIYGSLAGFTILDDRDDNMLMSIRVTPLSIYQYLSFKLAIVFVFSFVGCIYVMWFSNIGDLPLGNIVSIAFMTSLAAPMTALFINAFAKNKIEGFAVMKTLGTVIVFPIIALFLVDKREFFFAFAPGYWPAKALSVLFRGENLLLLSYHQYYIGGLLYGLILNVLSFSLFQRKTMN